jgi:EthD domain
MRKAGEALVAAAGLKLMSFDGMVDFWVRDFEDLVNAFMDPDFAEVIEDEERIMERAATQMMVGREIVVIEDGKIVTPMRATSKF